MAETTGAVYEFGPFRLDAARRLLTRADLHVTLAPKTFDLLVLLVESRGRVFAKKELMRALWPDTFVEDANLTFQISALRKALGPDGSEWIETLPRFGYRFSNKVLEVDAISPPEHAIHLLSEHAAGPLESHVASDYQRYYWLLIGALSVALAYLAFIHLREPGRKERAITFQISPPDHISTPDVDSIALSPDGDQLVFVGLGPDGGRKLWLRTLGSLKATEIAGTEQVESAFWSPDGRSLAFFAAGKLKRLDLPSGFPLVICETPVARSSGTWSRQGVILFETLDRSEIYSVSATGGSPKAVTQLDPANKETRHSAPQFLPDGRHFIYFVQSEQAESTGIYLGDLDSKRGDSKQDFKQRDRRLTSSDANGVYARLPGGDSYLLSARGTDLIGQKFDLAKLALEGARFVVSRHLMVTLAGGLPRAAVSASENGVLAYRSRIDAGSTELRWFDRSGKRLEPVGDSGDYSNPALSPGEKKLMVSRMDPQTRTRDLWLFDFSNGASSRFTFDPADETNPVWSPNGARVTFNMVRNGVSEIYEKEIAGASEPRLVRHSKENKFIHGFSPDGKLLLFRVGPQTWVLPMLGGDQVIGPYAMENPRISPNGKWVVYTSNQSGRSEVYVQSFPPAKGKWQISTAGGAEPTWRSDGKELFYVSAGKLIATQVRTDVPVFEAGSAGPLFGVRLEGTVRRSRYQAASNGTRFLVNSPIEASPIITVAIDWLPNTQPNPAE